MWFKRFFSWVAVVGVLVLVGMGGTWMLMGNPFQQRHRETMPSVAQLADVDADAIAVTIAPVIWREVERKIEVVGTLHGFEEVSLVTKVDGRVRRLLHDIADQLQPMEPVMELDPTDYQLAVRQAEKALEVELARLGLTEPPSKDFDIYQLPAIVQAKVRLENSLLRLDRVRKAGGAASPEDITERLTESKLAASELENQVIQTKSALVTIQLKQEALAMAKQQLLDTVLRVPQPSQKLPGHRDQTISYTISNRSISEGTYVRAGTEVARLVIDQVLKLRVQLPERHTAEVKQGMHANVYTAAYPKPFLGKVTRISPVVDPVNRTFEVEILIDNADRRLKPGSFAKALIATRVDRDAVTVPLEAISYFAGITKIFVVDGHQVRTVQVQLGEQSTTWVEIREPALPKNVQVVVSGWSKLVDGSTIRIRRPESTSPSPAPSSTSTLEPAMPTKTRQ